MGELEKLINQSVPPATPATSATQDLKSSESSESSKGVVFDFEPERSRRAIERREQARRKRLEPLFELIEKDGKQPKRFYWVTDNESDPDHVILVWWVRDIDHTFEQSIPREKYDGFKLLEILEGLDG